MPNIRLPSGQVLSFEHPVTVQEVADSISVELAKNVLAAKIGDQLVDTHYTIQHDLTLTLITERDPAGLEVIRHSTAHLLAHAIKRLFPEVQFTIGPMVEDGFYYDFDYSETFTPDDFPRIEQAMQAIVAEDLPIVREEVSRDAAIELFKEMGEHYKVELINDIPLGDAISLYRQGDFVDLCRGPHVPSTGRLKAFKLMKVAGAYWRGDSNNKMLQRLYGTAFATEDALQNYLHILEEAKKRDHRKIGVELDLFHTQPEAPGMIFWHAKGWRIVQTMEQYMRSHLDECGYQEVSAPLMLDRVLWEKSGHWTKYSDLMFTTSSENHDYAIKPMNCPGHIQIYNQGLKSYRDLPIRMAEFGLCHRNEYSGTLHGIMRTRQFVQDDGHIFCTVEQMQSEIKLLIALVYRVYDDFGFKHDDVLVRIATRPEKRIGSNEVWDKAEQALEVALTDNHVDFELALGEGAFYGPKIEFHLRDCLNRLWQCGTIQVDFSMPERLDAHYIAEDGSRKSPVMIHRAILGSISRFLGMLIEHYAGLMPVWLSPVQAVVMNITDQQSEFAQQMTQQLKKSGIKAISDLRNEKIGLKIRERTLERIPYLLIVGNREVERSLVSVRLRSGEDLGNMSIEDFIRRVHEEIENYH